jgi:hypothetical protein
MSYRDICYEIDGIANVDERVTRLQSIITRLPITNQGLLQYLMMFLNKVSIS